MLILGLDPGSAHSALVVIHAGDGRVEFSAYEPNDEMLYVLEVYRRQWPAVLVIEKIESYGMPVGREVFDTVFFSGMASQVWKGRDVYLLPRREVKLHICASPRAKDANIRQALIDRYGGSRKAAFGTKKAPGPLYGLTGHHLAALAVALTWRDRHVVSSPSISRTPQEVPHVR